MSVSKTRKIYLPSNRTAVRLVPPNELQQYVNAGWTKTQTVNHGGVDWFVVKRNRDGNRVQRTSRDIEWTRIHDEQVRRMKPNKTYFDDELPNHFKEQDDLFEI